MNAFKRWRNRIQNLLQSPERRLNRRQRAMRYAIELPLHCVRELRHDRAGQMAAALTYHTLFSLLPTLVLGMVALNAFVDETERDRFRDSVVEIILPITLADGDDNGDDPDATRRRRELHEGRQIIASKIEAAMGSLNNLHFGGIGIAGVLVFIYGATALLSTVERSFNAIFGVTRARPWYIRLPLYYTVITLGPVVILLGQWLHTWLKGLFANGSVGWFTGALILSPLLSTWLVVFFAYVLIPHTRVRFRTAMIGSGIAALLILLFVEGFRIYVRVYIGSTAVETVYGALALLPLCLLWLYLVWLIILFGVEITHTLQAMKGRSFKHQAHRLTTDMVIDPAWILPLAARIAKSFARGHLADVATLGEGMGLSPRAVQQLIDTLEGAGLVRYAAEGRKRGYTLSRPADQIGVHELLQASEDLLPPVLGARSQKDPAWRLVRQLHQAGDEMAKAKTLADISK